MKTLVLCRHAKSSWKYPTEDIYRPLNKRGIADAPAMASLGSSSPPNLALCSPAVRTYATALAFFLENRWPLERLSIKAELFEADLDRLKAMIVECDNSKSCLWVFSHNPGLNALIDYFKPGAIDNIVTCGMVRLSLDIQHWDQISAKVVTDIEYNYPRERSPSK